MENVGGLSFTCIRRIVVSANCRLYVVGGLSVGGLSFGGLSINCYSVGGLSVGGLSDNHPIHQRLPNLGYAYLKCLRDITGNRRRFKLNTYFI
jgi:hypothetical protein